MAIVIVEETVNAPVTEVWASWDNFGDIYRFNPNITGSHILDGSAKTGPGAQRQCDLDAKNYIRERIVGYEPERKLVIDIYEGTLPLKSAKATFDLTPLGPDRTKVVMTMEFHPKMGLLGRLMVPMMKPKFASMLQALLAGNRAFVERGVEVQAA